MSDYSKNRFGKLRLKNYYGDSITKRQKKRKISTLDDNKESIMPSKEAIEESRLHGGWWIVSRFELLPAGNVAIQIKNDYFLTSMDDGTFSLQPPNEVTNGPSENQIFRLCRCSESKFSMKCHHGKFIGINARGEIFAKSEAITPLEQIELIIQEGKIALQGSNGHFLKYSKCGSFSAISAKALTDDEIFVLRSNHCLRSIKCFLFYSFSKKNAKNEDDFLDTKELELKYVRQFQSYQDRKLKLNKSSLSEIDQALNDGKVREKLLDRREKMKSDKYCK